MRGSVMSSSIATPRLQQQFHSGRHTTSMNSATSQQQQRLRSNVHANGNASRHPTPNQPQPQPRHRLLRDIEQGSGEWSAVPHCVRTTIADLLLSSTPPPAQKATGGGYYASSSRQAVSGSASVAPPVSFAPPPPFHTSDDGTRRQKNAPMTPSSSWYATPPAPTESSRRGGAYADAAVCIRPLPPLHDDSMLMSVRTFEDAEALREHAVHNIALFHNNVEQMSRDTRLHLLPELRASLQLHPSILRDLKSRWSGGDTPHGAWEAPSLSRSVAQQTAFEGQLLDDLTDALHRLRRASLRFVANYLSDAEKLALGIDPRILPRETLPNAADNDMGGDGDVAAATGDEYEVVIVDGTAAVRSAAAADDNEIHRYGEKAPEENHDAPPRTSTQSYVDEDQLPLSEQSPRRSRGDPVDALLDRNTVTTAVDSQNTSVDDGEPRIGIAPPSHIQTTSVHTFADDTREVEVVEAVGGRNQPRWDSDTTMALLQRSSAVHGQAQVDFSGGDARYAATATMGEYHHHGVHRGSGSGSVYSDQPSQQPAVTWVSTASRTTLPVATNNTGGSSHSHSLSSMAHAAQVHHTPPSPSRALLVEMESSSGSHRHRAAVLQATEHADYNPGRSSHYSLGSFPSQSSPAPPGVDTTLLVSPSERTRDPQFFSSPATAPYGTESAPHVFETHRRQLHSQRPPTSPSASSMGATASRRPPSPSAPRHPPTPSEQGTTVNSRLMTRNAPSSSSMTSLTLPYGHPDGSSPGGYGEVGNGSDDAPVAVQPPGTPRTRNDFFVYTPPRSINVKKKTMMVPRSASQSLARDDATSLRSLSPDMQNRQTSPFNASSMNTSPLQPLPAAGALGGRSNSPPTTTVDKGVAWSRESSARRQQQSPQHTRGGLVPQPQSQSSRW